MMSGEGEQSGEAATAKTDLIQEDQARCVMLCRNYLRDAVVEFRGSVDKAKGEMRALWNIRAPPAKGKKGKAKKKK